MAVVLVLISSKNNLKANHNAYGKTTQQSNIGFNILKEQFESKSQLWKQVQKNIFDWF